ncbi:hypothetical protein [Planctomicrobium sp. SH664]|uniref:hypothetical protein n=1 Tax=Planctomicrobium sp. SH664 TaxID=3448125 RepID=UPI003F5B82AF
MSQTAADPFVAPIPRGTRILQATLRVGVAVQCFGLAISVLVLRGESPLVTWCVRHAELNPAGGLLVDRRLAMAVAIAGCFSLLRPAWFVLVPLGIFQLLQGGFAALLAESGTGLLIFCEQACRVALPFGLLLIDFWPPAMRPSLALNRLAVLLLRLATIVAAVSWGIHALIQYQRGGDLVVWLQLTCSKLLQRDVEASTAQAGLAVLGAICIAGGLCLALSRNRLVAGGLSGWGFLHAFSQVIAAGGAGAGLALAGFGDGVAPLVVLLFWMLTIKEHGPTYLTEPSPAPSRR